MRRPATSLVACAVALVAVACGGDDTSPAGPDVTFASPTTTPVPDSIQTTTTGPPESTPTSDASAPETTNEPVVPVEPDAPALGPALVTLVEPVDLAVRPGDDTLYIVERIGRVQAVRDGVVADAPVLDISDATENRGEQGLLGLAFSLDGDTAFVNYTDLDGTTVIESFPVTTDGAFDVTARAVVLTIDQPFGNHNGGAVLVGPDGLLYVPTGDGGSGGDPLRVSLDVSSLLGKVLRVAPRPGGGYDVPDDNPFVGVEGAEPAVWSVGLRNPWRVSFDLETGDLWIADVGQSAIEEISVAWADEGLGRGVSFGWSAYEGTARFNNDQPADGHVPPIFEYRHEGNGCSVSGGVRYRGNEIAGLAGSYVFGDFCSGRVWTLPIDGKQAGTATEIGRVPSVAAVVQGPHAELYVLDLGGGVYPIIAA